MTDLIEALRNPLLVTDERFDLTREAADEIERLRAALMECAAEYRSPPTTVMGAAGHVAREFKRRMELAAAALAGKVQP